MIDKNFFWGGDLDFFDWGQTMNACDRLFNLMKKSFHKKNSYTYKQLLSALEKHNQVNVVDFDSNKFVDWNKFFIEM